MTVIKSFYMIYIREEGYFLEMINKINRKQMERDALNSGNYDKYILDIILSKLDDLIDYSNGECICSNCEHNA